jgi:GAF domain-containing protein
VSSNPANEQKKKALAEIGKAITSTYELAAHYVLQGEPVVIPDAIEDVQTIYHKEAKAEGVDSILAVPSTVREEPIGMMRLLTGQVR